MTKNERIYLIGPRGSGKSTVGRLLADKLGWGFADADEALEAAAGKSITDIFASEGEIGFRNREADLLRELTRLEQHVIACGGGIVLRPHNRALLRASGHCIWLTGDPKTLCARLECDPITAARRPPLTDLPGPEEIEHVLREREPSYLEVAHFAVATDGRSPADLVSDILSAWTTSRSICP